ncbi:hypothetical protein [Saccharolobus islandicus]|uniref:hypothetical protein n=1 Tax=Saccharolobus islandicus TaxID=43080 RepID=UPI00064EB314|nr:hypothetical protein [Sulfolobus islandicus]
MKIYFPSLYNSPPPSPSVQISQQPAIVVNQPPPPWYVQYIPEFIIVAGIVATVLTFYFSPELRNGLISKIRHYTRK